MAVFIKLKRKRGGLPALIDSDDPVLIDSDQAPINSDPTLMNYYPALTGAVSNFTIIGGKGQSHRPFFSLTTLRWIAGY